MTGTFLSNLPHITFRLCAVHTRLCSTLTFSIPRVRNSRNFIFCLMLPNKLFKKVQSKKLRMPFNSLLMLFVFIFSHLIGVHKHTLLRNVEVYATTELIHVFLMHCSWVQILEIIRIEPLCQICETTGI